MSFHISDTHFNHDKIIEYCNRPFANAEEMNEYIIKQWNSAIGKNDTVYHHGDVALHCDKNLLKSLIQQLNGSIILIMGNHDRRSRGWFLDCGFVEVYKKPIQVDNYILSHAPVEDLGYGLINIHGHLHGIEKGLDKSRYIDVSCEVNKYKPIWIK